MNKQPFYYGVMINFTATRELNLAELQSLFEKIPSRDILKDTIEVEEFDVEAGDPGDLM